MYSQKRPTQSRWRRIGAATFVAAFAILCGVKVHGAESSPPMQIDIDATDLPRKLLTATIVIPVEPEDESDRQIALWYPKWVPGSHGPGGPIANVAGLIVADEQGQALPWKRTVGELYRIEVTVPPGVSRLHVRVRYITNQPTTTSMGHDSYGSDLIGVIGPGTVLVYPENADIDQLKVAGTLRLPDQWVASTALARRGEFDDADVMFFEPVSLRTLVDSPIMCGRHRRIHNLVESEHRDTIPPHRLHVFSEAESVLEPHAELLSKLRRMVTQTALLFDSHPFEHFDILLATTDLLVKNGLEHSRCTFNVLPQRAFQAPDELKGWDRLLVPHEYIHAWCGKYRRPANMLTSDFHTPKATDLLWVYEGLTQYLGELMEARCGLMSETEFRHRLSVEIRHALYQQGRAWRSLLDTAACSAILRGKSASWPRLRRSQDYYMEGMLFWIEADAKIRSATDGRRSLDDFCRDFFRATKDSPHPHAFTRADVVTSLNRVLPYDWDGLISRRIEGLAERYEPAVVGMLGYSVQYTNEIPSIPEKTFRAVEGVDAYDSIGAVVSEEGVISDLLFGSPAHQAGLGPGMKIAGVNGHTWSSNRLLDAISKSATTGGMKLMVVNGDSFRTHDVEYDGGPRHMVLVRDEDANDVLADILKAR